MTDISKMSVTMRMIGEQNGTFTIELMLYGVGTEEDAQTAMDFMRHTFCGNEATIN